MGLFAQILIYGGLKCQSILKIGSYTYYSKKTTTTLTVAPEFHVVKVIRDFDCKSTPDLLHIEVNEFRTRTFEFDFPITSVYDRNFLQLLAQNGVAVHPDFAESIANIIFKGYNACITSNAIEYRHSALGWQDDLFLYDYTTLPDGTKSRCSRENFRFRNGDKYAYENFLKSTVYPCPTLSLALSIGYAAVVSARLKDTFDLGTIIVNFCGASSTGKTTAEQLLVSPFASPVISNKDGLARTFFSTANALFAALNGIYGLPIVLDDITTNTEINKSNLLYTLASGEQKSRCNTDGSIKNITSGWSGIIVISSETPVLDDAGENQGLKARVIQTDGITWTPDAATAELVKRTVQDNYGHTGIDFAKHIAAIPIDILSDRFRQSKETVHALMTQRDNLSDRLENKYATFHLTIKLMNDCFDCSLNADELIALLLKPEQDGVTERRIDLKALECVKQYIYANANHFEVVNNNNPSDLHFARGEKYGDIHISKTRYDVFIPTDRIKNLLESEKINEYTTVKKQWKEHSITVCDKDRYDCKKNGIRCLHFVFDGAKSEFAFNLSDEYKEPAEPTAQPVPPQTPLWEVAIDDEKAIEEVFNENLD